MISPSAESEPGFCENLGFVMTYRCQVACPHCILGAGPDRTEEMSEADILTWIEQASRVGGGGRIRTVCLTGGEPFINLDRLRQVSLFALSLGMLPTAVTNAYWAGTPDQALRTLESLPALRVISISTDAHHLPRIPLTRVLNALNAAIHLELAYSVAVCTEDAGGSAHQALLAQLSQMVPRDRIRVTVTSPAGRAASLVQIAPYAMTDERPAAACNSAHTPVVFPDGRVAACIGPVIDIDAEHPLLLGNLRRQTLQQILDDAESNPVLHILRVWGPGRLCEILEARGLGHRLPTSYIRGSLCNLCYTLLQDPVLREALAGLSQDADLLQKTAWAREFYLAENTPVAAG
jgi:hypothetical protein